MTIHIGLSHLTIITYRIVISNRDETEFDFDQRGSGQTDGERDHIGWLTRYVANFEKFFNEIVAVENCKPVLIIVLLKLARGRQDYATYFW